MVLLQYVSLLPPVGEPGGGERTVSVLRHGHEDYCNFKTIYKKITRRLPQIVLI